MRLKICGLRRDAEVAAVASAGADLVGLWHGIAGGYADLDVERLTTLAAAARHSRVEPALVTFLSEPDRLRRILERARIGCVQLHGFQPPSLVQALRSGRAGPLQIIKVLHIRGTTCLEGGLIPAYEAAGTDVFLLDAATADGRVGSTGERLAPSVVARVGDRLRRPFMLAGGLTAEQAIGYRDLLARRHFIGIDVDGAARGPDGLVCPRRVETLRAAWQQHQEEVRHAA